MSVCVRVHLNRVEGRYQSSQGRQDHYKQDLMQLSIYLLYTI